MHKKPRVSVIIPSLDGYRDGNLDKLKADLKEQSFTDFELRVVESIKPNGRARNVGAQDAQGDILVFIDDDIRLGHNKVLENLILPLLSNNKIAVTGASVVLTDKANYVQKQYEKIRNFTSAVKEVMDYEGKISHACLAIKKSIFQELGGEREDLITGTDIDLNNRVKQRGYVCAVVAHTWVYHLMPNSFTKLNREAYNCGLGLAYAHKRSPETFGLPQIKFTNFQIKTPYGAFFYKIFTTLVKLPFYLLTLRPIHFLFYLFYLIGYISGWLKF